MTVKTITTPTIDELTQQIESENIQAMMTFHPLSQSWSVSIFDSSYDKIVERESYSLEIALYTAINVAKERGIDLGD